MKKLVIAVDLSDEDAKMYDLISDDSNVLHIFFVQCKQKIKSQIYICYHTYRDFVKGGK